MDPTNHVVGLDLVAAFVRKRLSAAVLWEPR